MTHEQSQEFPRATPTGGPDLVAFPAPHARSTACGLPPIPGSPEDATASSGHGPAGSAEPASLVVLLVEDDALIRMDAADMLVEVGHEVIETEYGPDALVVLGSRRVDVLVTDVGLPGMSGLELAERARRLQPGIGVVFATGDTELPQAEKVLGAVVFLCKPYDSAGLARSVRQALDSR